MRQKHLTKPNWGDGTFAYYEGDRLEGYFRRFTSAYLWLNEQRRLYPDLPRQTVSHKGAVVFVRNVSTVGDLAR